MAAHDEHDKPGDEVRPRWRALLEAGAEFLGGTTGAAVGTIGGPAGVVGGAAAGVVVTRALMQVGDEIEGRLTGPAQRERMGGALFVAFQEIEARLAANEQPRRDGFFEADNERERPVAEELLEGVLLRAGDSYEQKRVPFLGRLYASVAFQEDISPAYSHYLLRVADRLSFRQLALLALFADEQHRDALRRVDRHLSEVRGERPTPPEPATLAELNQLGNDNLLGFRQQGGSVAHFAAVIEGGSFAGSYSKTAPTPLGQTLFEVMELAKIPRPDLEGLMQELAPGAPVRL